jgi:hypothetical protein
LLQIHDNAAGTIVNNAQKKLLQGTLTWLGFNKIVIGGVYNACSSANNSMPRS